MRAASISLPLYYHQDVNLDLATGLAYIERMEIELQKMAARGLTVIAGSGDAGWTNVGEMGNDLSNVRAGDGLVVGCCFARRVVFHRRPR